ncbi:hypothetical protein [Sphingomonas sp. VNH70]|uniref:hypothetical protein n=1 Tax=Sphingomonas silueang TaxID=3156617 RepID=UPI0032B611BE
MIATRAVFILAATLSLAACDNRPNPGFEQSVKDREAAGAGDAYAALDSNYMIPRQFMYVRQKEEQRQDYAAGQAGTYRASYDTLLKRLDADRNVDRKSTLFARCRPAFSAASAYQRGAAKVTAAASAPARDAALAGLKRCRAAAQAAIKAGGDAGKPAALITRFASAGMLLVGVTVVGQGDTDNGLRLWRHGHELVSADRPGFQLNARALRGY